MIISHNGSSPTAQEVERITVLAEYERSLGGSGSERVAGVDEAGRGPLAGPLVAAAVVLEPGVLLAGIDDSKKLSRRKREKLFDLIRAHSIAVSTSIVDVNVIDTLNVRGAANEAMRRAIAGLNGTAGFALIDGLSFENVPVPHRFVKGGDGKCISIAAASIVAKVTRDRIMKVLDLEYPAYGFSQHKGYPTSGHRKALAENGPAPVHRMSFPAVRRILGEPDRPDISKEVDHPAFDPRKGSAGKASPDREKKDPNTRR